MSVPSCSHTILRQVPRNQQYDASAVFEIYFLKDDCVMAASLYSEAGCTMAKGFVLGHKLGQTNAAKIDANSLWPLARVRPKRQRLKNSWDCLPSGKAPDFGNICGFDVPVMPARDLVVDNQGEREVIYY